MNERRTDGGIPSLLPIRRRAGSRSLLRSRSVQALLVATAVLQGVAGMGRPDGVTRQEARAAESADVLSALLPSPGIAEAAVMTDGERLAAEYRSRGYPVSDALAGEIVRAAVQNGISPELAFGLVRTESEFKPTARSPVGAIGLAQLMPATARLLRPGTTEADLKDPEINLALGFRYLRDLVERYEGDTEMALLAYNRGTGTVDRAVARGEDPDNGYADLVMGRE